MFALIGPDKLPPMGSNIMQFFIAYYPEPYSYVNIVSVAALLASLCIFYLYGRSARPLIAIAPMMVFFVSWRNAPTYGIPYVILLLAAYYTGNRPENEGEKDMTKGAKPMCLILLSLLALSIFLAVLMHAMYVRSNILRIISATPELFPGPAG